MKEIDDVKSEIRKRRKYLLGIIVLLSVDGMLILGLDIFQVFLNILIFYGLSYAFYNKSTDITVLTAQNKKVARILFNVILITFISISLKVDALFCSVNEKTRLEAFYEDYSILVIIPVSLFVLASYFLLIPMMVKYFWNSILVYKLNAKTIDYTNALSIVLIFTVLVGPC